jgi:hypothetical protein
MGRLRDGNSNASIRTVLNKQQGRRTLLVDERIGKEKEKRNGHGDCSDRSIRRGSAHAQKLSRMGSHDWEVLKVLKMIWVVYFARAVHQLDRDCIMTSSPFMITVRAMNCSRDTLRILPGWLARGIHLASRHQSNQEYVFLEAKGRPKRSQNSSRN